MMLGTMKRKGDNETAQPSKKKVKVLMRMLISWVPVLNP